MEKKRAKLEEKLRREKAEFEAEMAKKKKTRKGKKRQ